MATKPHSRADHVTRHEAPVKAAPPPVVTRPGPAASVITALKGLTGLTPEQKAVIDAQIATLRSL